MIKGFDLFKTKTHLSIKKTQTNFFIFEKTIDNNEKH